MLDVVYPYRLEPARIADAALLAGMSHELVESGLRPAWDAARIAWHIRHPDSVVLAARAGTAIVGFAIMRYADDSAHLNLLAVAPEHRRRGIARRLLKWLADTPLTPRTVTIPLQLPAGNARARAVYTAPPDLAPARGSSHYPARDAAIPM